MVLVVQILQVPEEQEVMEVVVLEEQLQEITMEPLEQQTQVVVEVVELTVIQVPLVDQELLY